MNDFITTKEAANLIGVSVKQIQVWLKAGRIPAKKYGPNWLIKNEDVAEFAVKERQPGRPRKQLKLK